jgi:hypothetical protein
MEPLQDGDGEGGCFAGSSLGAAQHVASFQGVGDGLCLYGRGLMITFLIERFQNGLEDGKFFE